MRLDAKVLQSMQRGHFAVYIRGLSRDEMIVNVAKPDFASIKNQEDTPDQEPTMHAPPSIVNIDRHPPAVGIITLR